MRLPDWLVKAGARLEGTKLYFDDVEVEYLFGDIKEGEIPTVYEVRHADFKARDAGEKWWTGHSCGLDLVTSKELVWIRGAYFDTFRQAFRHWRDVIREQHEGQDFVLCEDHNNLVEYCPCSPRKVLYRPDTIKLEV